MLFNSYIFVLLFLPISLIVYFIFGKLERYKEQRVSLIISSCIFYGYANIYYLFLLICSIIFNYGLSQIIFKSEEKGRRIRVLASGVIMNLALLFFFKYYNFFISNLNVIFAADFAFLNVMLPVGISFFTFQQISYIVEAYRVPEKMKEYTLLDYMSFVTFYPQLTSGPISRHDEIISQLKEKENLFFKIENFSQGLYTFAIGLFKKVLLADTFGKIVSWGYGLESFDELSAATTAIIILAYTLQIYLDFCGYCEMAAGIAKMYNISLPLNFNLPYKAVSVLEFWERWHMTLTRFLRTYVYFPLGGSRKGKVRTYFNIIIVFLVSGLWHGPSWTYIFWGLLHGTANVCNRIFKSTYEKIWLPIRWCLTFCAVNIFWVFFRAQSISQAFQLINRLFSGAWGGIRGNFVSVSVD